MPSPALLPLAVAVGLAAPSVSPDTVPLNHLAAKSSANPSAIPSPKLTEMRVVVDTRGETRLVCHERVNPLYQRAIESARAGAKEPVR